MTAKRDSLEPNAAEGYDAADMATKKSRSGTPWTEAQREEAGTTQVKVRLSLEHAKHLRELAKGSSMRALIESLIDDAWRKRR